jgi:hypothetical protein
MNNLANTLLTRSRGTGDLVDIVEAIGLLREALSLQPPGHPDRADTLHNLSDAHYVHYACEMDEEALKAALEFKEACLLARPDGHPDRHQTHNAIAGMQLLDSPHFDWDKALENIHVAIADDIVSYRKRLHGAIGSLKQVERATARDVPEFIRSQPALEAYVAAIRLLPRVANLSLGLSLRLRELSGSEELCRTAAMRAFVSNQPTTAIELLEEGKTVFWQQALQTRASDLDTLPSDDKNQLQGILHRLEQENEPIHASDRAAIEQRAEERRLLNIQAERLIDEIRTRPGFERFLKIPDYARLRQAAASGPVVILIDASSAFFALIIKSQNDIEPTAIALPSITVDHLHELRAQVSMLQMRELMENLEPAVDEVDRGLFNISRPMKDSTLGQIWKKIVYPVVEVLKLPVRPHALATNLDLMSLTYMNRRPRAERDRESTGTLPETSHFSPSMQLAYTKATTRFAPPITSCRRIHRPSPLSLGLVKERCRFPGRNSRLFSLPNRDLLGSITFKVSMTRSIPSPVSLSLCPRALPTTFTSGPLYSPCSMVFQRRTYYT